MAESGGWSCGAAESGGWSCGLADSWGRSCRVAGGGARNISQLLCFLAFISLASFFIVEFLPAEESKM